MRRFADLSQHAVCGFCGATIFHWTVLPVSSFMFRLGSQLQPEVGGLIFDSYLMLH